MGLEISTTINGLNEAWPLGTDKKGEGDDHLRLLKTVLQEVFDDADGSGVDPNPGGPQLLFKALGLTARAAPTLPTDLALNSQIEALQDTIDTTTLKTIVRSVKTVSGTYTKPAGLKFLEVICVGGGGGGSNAAPTGVSQSSAGGGGGGGGTAIKLYAAAAIPASVAYVVGAGGGAPAGEGAAGGTTTWMGLTASGGGGGGTVGPATGLIGSPTLIASAGAAAGGDLNLAGERAAYGWANCHGRIGLPIQGGGGASFLARQQVGLSGVPRLDGTTGIFPGGGGSGGSCGASVGTGAGGSGGGAGVIILTEYF